MDLLLGEVLARSREWLKSKGIENAARETDELAARCLACTRMDLYLSHDRPVDENRLQELRQLLKRRASGEPLQYLLGNQPFRNAELRVDARVLIPRPETEELVELVLKGERGRGPRSILDAGTGSGCIAISLAQELQDCRILAVDLQPAALELAGENARANKVSDRITFSRMDLLRDTPENPVDVLVSNPPYVSPSEKGRLQPELLWEPQDALYADDDGLLFYRRFARSMAAFLKPGGHFYFEIGEDQGSRLLNMYHTLSSEMRVLKDLAGKDRFLAGRFTGGGEVQS